MEVPQFDVNYMAEVLADIWGREHGCKVTIKLTPKDCPAPKDGDG